MSAEWWIRDGQTVHGPMSLEELKEAATSGSLKNAHEVRLGHTTSWVRADGFGWLSECLTKSETTNCAAIVDSDPNSTELAHESDARESQNATTIILALAMFMGSIVLLCLLAMIVVGHADRGRAQPVPAQASTPNTFSGSRTMADSFNAQAGAPAKSVGARLIGDTSIANVRDEKSIKQAVGLVCCGWRFENGKGERFEVPDFGSGTCFLISADGYALTNRHVVEKVSEVGKSDLPRAIRRRYDLQVAEPTVWVILSGDVYQARVVFQSKQFDFAIMKIAVTDAPFFNLSLVVEPPRASSVWAIGFPGAASVTLPGEEGYDERRIGAFFKSPKDIATFYRPSDFEYVMTSGTVSVVKGREGVGLVIQHNADISGGNSGGPLVNEQAVAVGINTFSIEQALGGQASGVFYALGLSQLRKDIDRYVPHTVWN